ncbi:L-threonylcarbamoyladenylate synthase [Paenibacillus sp. YYML68]|uniref:L-threonylcarbamoyladenylate synthase n=1 Tax=Paenibacillus sp. YYML68 TaxID=2909250 RepID=UPI002490A9A6|nr:L-threonylcarbamoyladenylate synthase [Paenibacillus sp. YYML68]
MNIETKMWLVHASCPQEEQIQEAAAWLREGRTVAFPTETVYGLGADARSTEAVAAIFEAKGRPSDNPLIVHLADRSQLTELTASPEEAVLCLLDAFWPGPLTVVLPVREGVLSPLVTAGLSTVGVRIPDHPVARALIAAAGCPVAAPSANRSGRPSPTLAAHVLEDLGGRIAGIVDGGAAGVGVESTVVEYRDGTVYVLRPGGVTAGELARTLPDGVRLVMAAEAAPAAEETPRAPGMKYAHYAPRGLLTIVHGHDREAVLARMRRELEAARARGERTGALLLGGHAEAVPADHVSVCGERTDLELVARGLYAALRAFDEAGASFIVAEACPETGLGEAIMNRLRKAAGGRELHV